MTLTDKKNIKFIFNYLLNYALPNTFKPSLSTTYLPMFSDALCVNLNYIIHLFKVPSKIQLTKCQNQHNILKTHELRS